MKIIMIAPYKDIVQQAYEVFEELNQKNSEDYSKGEFELEVVEVPKDMLDRFEPSCDVLIARSVVAEVFKRKGKICSRSRNTSCKQRSPSLFD